MDNLCVERLGSGGRIYPVCREAQSSVPIKSSDLPRAARYHVEYRTG